MAAIEKRTAQDGAVSYRVKVRLKGKPAQSATFDRLTDAKKWAASIESAIREGRHFTKAEAKRHTLADMVDRYTRDVLPGKRSQKDQATQLQWWRDTLGAYTLADITPALIAEGRDKLAQRQSPKGTGTLSPATVVRYMAALSHAFTIAVREWGWLEDSPMRRVSKPKEPRGRVRFLSDDERGRLLAACKASSNAALYPVVVLALSSGMRAGEIMGLYWREPKTPPAGAWGVVDLEAGRIVLHQTKNNERRVLPLVGHAAECVRELAKVRRLDSDLLFPSSHRPRHGGPVKPVDLRKPWETALKRAEIENFHFHDLRHSAASYLAMNGASLAEIAETLGHKTLQMVKRYSHLSEAHTAAVVGRMNAAIFGGGV
jgi:integrase